MPARMRLILLSALAVFLVACPSRSNPLPANATPAMLEAAVARWTDADQAQLDRGRSLIVHHCNACHGWPKPDEVGAAEWPGTVRSMARKAKLDAQQTEDVLRYLMAALAAQDERGH